MTAQEPTDAAMEQAADWYALLRSEEALPADRVAWQAWLDADAGHRLAWQYVERISQRFEPVQRSAQRVAAVSALSEAHGHRVSRRRVLAGLSIVVGGSAAWLLAQPASDAVLAWRADHSAGTGTIRQVTLADGTQVWLNAQSAFEVDYTPQQRRLRLLRGEILIDTAADPGRPFLVEAPQGLLRALGTRFTVRLDGEQALLAVYQGAVELRPVQGRDGTVVQAGQQAVFNADAVLSRQAADPAREAWTRGVLVARDLPLRALVDEMRRYHAGHIGLADEVADLRVAGSYPISDPERALAMLQSVLPIRVSHPLPWWIRVQKQE